MQKSTKSDELEDMKAVTVKLLNMLVMQGKGLLHELGDVGEVPPSL